VPSFFFSPTDDMTSSVDLADLESRVRAPIIDAGPSVLPTASLTCLQWGVTILGSDRRVASAVRVGASCRHVRKYLFMYVCSEWV
jgi:hypothetical protein